MGAYFCVQADLFLVVSLEGSSAIFLAPPVFKTFQIECGEEVGPEQSRLVWTSKYFGGVAMGAPCMFGRSGAQILSLLALLLNGAALHHLLCEPMAKSSHFIILSLTCKRKFYGNSLHCLCPVGLSSVHSCKCNCQINASVPSR